MKELLVSPPAVLIFGIIVQVLLHFYFPLTKIVPVQLSFLGLVLIVLSLIFSTWQFFTMKGKTPLPYGSKPMTLITNGPFRYTRNTFYLSIVLISLGMAIYLSDVTPFAVVIIDFFILDKYLIPEEEKVLEKEFGQSYKDYKQRVHRWI